MPAQLNCVEETLIITTHMKAEHIQTEEAKIDELIKKTYVDPVNPNLKPILDGAVDAALYAKAPVKILWILKEPVRKGSEGVGVRTEWH